MPVFITLGQDQRTVKKKVNRILTTVASRILKGFVFDFQTKILKLKGYGSRIGLYKERAQVKLDSTDESQADQHDTRNSFALHTKVS